MFNPGPLDPETLVTSVHVSSVTLFRIRCVILIYLIAVMIGEFVYDSDRFWGYFTEWSWIGLIFYFATAVYNGHVYHSRKDAVVSMQARPYWVQYLNWLAYILPATQVYIVSIVFWALLSHWIQQAIPLNKWIMVSQHSFNSLIMIAELVLGRVPFAYAFCAPFVVISLLYLGLAFVFHNATGIWAYSFLDTSKPFVWAWYAGVICFFLILFFGIGAIHKGRDKRRVRKGMKVVGSEKGTSADIVAAIV
ncbi:hypothetical protein BDR26DRAFT_1005733 [Obelidium mucronatum]|nr:hypothetical protein BDR26DRAFT_1005733 [Obelidium mucronatum]